MGEPELRALARAALSHAYAPYSGFAVGAAVLGASGRAYVGVNVENASYGLTICAERSAVAAAVGAGERRLLACATASTGGTSTPCGACRQVLAEFLAPDAPVHFVADGAERTRPFGELLPGAFALTQAAAGAPAAGAPARPHARRRGRAGDRRRRPRDEATPDPEQRPEPAGG